MARNSVLLAKCRFCNKKNGHLHFDSRAATEDELGMWGSGNPKAVYESDILRFKTEASAPGPCKHCVYIGLGIELTCHKPDESDPFPDEYEMCWRSPEFGKLTANDCRWQLLLNVVNAKAYIELREMSRSVGLEKDLFGEHPALQEGEGGQRVTLLGIERPPRTEERDRCFLKNCQPDTEIHDCRFDQHWTASDQREFLVRGWALFAEDIERLTHELNALVDRITADCLAV